MDSKPIDFGIYDSNETAHTPINDIIEAHDFKYYFPSQRSGTDSKQKKKKKKK
eukprot:CAMPEP_0171762954 /NCGR_PEP_ID=MMETSP0991-20121206/48971_1 /TAXON_ID=483369 /ORGANISM="non described non described, Strain CCMP2098" /LENGTH=52 /DNA_ID=CAMNT_0012366531 /DNA_START=639 /DNA_END=794 /DNA_ORIENTATION=+